jgi:FkbM family methyltransferase
VIAIEASPSTYALLTRNLAMNDAANVRAVQVAVSDRRGKLELYEPFTGNIGAATTIAARGGRHVASVDAMPLEEILRPDEIARVRLIKLDVEGAEPPILMHLIDSLPAYPSNMDIVVEASPGDDAEAWRLVFERLTAAGFRAYAIENSYEIDWYLARRHPAELQEQRGVPATQQDLLFTRADRR